MIFLLLFLLEFNIFIDGFKFYNFQHTMQTRDAIFCTFFFSKCKTKHSFSLPFFYIYALITYFLLSTIIRLGLTCSFLASFVQKNHAKAIKCAILQHLTKLFLQAQKFGHLQLMSLQFAGLLILIRIPRIVQFRSGYL